MCLPPPVTARTAVPFRVPHVWDASDADPIRVSGDSSHILRHMPVGTIVELAGRGMSYPPTEIFHHASEQIGRVDLDCSAYQLGHHGELVRELGRRRAVEAVGSWWRCGSSRSSTVVSVAGARAYPADLHRAVALAGEHAPWTPLGPVEPLRHSDGRETKATQEPSGEGAGTGEAQHIGRGGEIGVAILQQAGDDVGANGIENRVESDLFPGEPAVQRAAIAAHLLGQTVPSSPQKHCAMPA
jgi:hypothetical protein